MLGTDSLQSLDVLSREKYYNTEIFGCLVNKIIFFVWLIRKYLVVLVNIITRCCLVNTIIFYCLVNKIIVHCLDNTMFGCLVNTLIYGFC
jgi:hypothetical protein